MKVLMSNWDLTGRKLSMQDREQQGGNFLKEDMLRRHCAPLFGHQTVEAKVPRN